MKTGSSAREPEAACGCGSPGFAHYPSLHPGRDRVDEVSEPVDVDEDAAET